MDGRVTLKDVARQAQVSVMTVSNVINGKFYHVTAETRKRVQAVVEALGYRADPAGRSLRLARRFSIGLIIVDPSPTFIADPYTTFLVAGLSNSLSRKGYGLLLQGTTLEELPQVLMLRQSLVDAICIFSSGSAHERRAAYRLVARHREPLVIFQDSCGANVKDVLAIRQDDSGGGRVLAQRLLKDGCRDFVFLTAANRWPALDARERGIRSALRKVDDASLVVVRAGSEDVESVQAALADRVEHAGLPDAVFAANDQLAIVAQSWLANHGWTVPHDVKVAGFNAFDSARFWRPKLTTIRSPAYELGELAASALLERLESGKFSRREIVLPVALHEGESA